MKSRIIEFSFGLAICSFPIYLFLSSLDRSNPPAMFFEIFVLLIGLGFVLSALRRKK